MRWLAKALWYSGDDTVLGYYESQAEAQARVDEWNSNYQTDTAYLEPWDDAKAAQWPTPGRRAYENALHR